MNVDDRFRNEDGHDKLERQGHDAIFGILNVKLKA